jgi:hypothetical protein
MLTENQRAIYESYELNLPVWFKKDLDFFKECMATKNSLIDCAWCEFDSDIKVALMNEQITETQASYFREKYLSSYWGDFEYREPFEEYNER